MDCSATYAASHGGGGGGKPLIIHKSYAIVVNY